MPIRLSTPMKNSKSKKKKTKIDQFFPSANSREAVLANNIKKLKPDLLSLFLLNDNVGYILKLISHGYDVYLGGQAGTGKSTLLRNVVKILQKDAKYVLFITATTGIAACNLHSPDIMFPPSTFFAVLGLVPSDLSNNVKEVYRRIERESSAKMTNLIVALKKQLVFIIDEISCMSAETFDFLVTYLNFVCNKNGIRPNYLFWLCGDFKQLEPVSTTDNPATPIFKSEEYQSRFAFEFNIIVLTRIYRQQVSSENTKFIHILTQLRNLTVTKEMIQMLNSRFGHTPPSDALRVFNVNWKVNDYNKSKLSQLEGKCTVFKPFLRGKRTQYDLKRFYSQNKYHPVLLKVGARVMVTANIDIQAQLVNGTLGTVTSISFDEKNIGKSCVSITYGEGKKADIKHEFIPWENKSNIKVGYMPLTLAWAITTNKSQGQTLPAVVYTWGNVFGQRVTDFKKIYIALSRVRKLGDFYLTGRLNWWFGKIPAGPMDEYVDKIQNIDRESILLK